ncbi:MAG: hypothetical protein U0586_00660 [Candidatus Brocadiaceae bacterium]
MLTENEIGEIMGDIAVAMHRELEPGLLESVYMKNGMSGIMNGDIL